MGKFNGKIHAEFTPPNTWVLEHDLSFQTDNFTNLYILTKKSLTIFFENFLFVQIKV